MKYPEMHISDFLCLGEAMKNHEGNIDYLLYAKEAMNYPEFHIAEFLCPKEATINVV